MWVEEFALENIRCFRRTEFSFVKAKDEPHRWVTLLGENGAGKSTVLQALALLLSGPEGAPQLLARPLGWLRDEGTPGKLSTRIRQDGNDPGTYGGDRRITRVFGYTFHVTGSGPLTIRNKVFTEPSIQPSPGARLTWLRENALTSKGRGWFAAGYGAFRRLTRSSQIIVPSLEPQARFTNFTTQFNEDQALATFERWMVYLDYRLAKAQKPDPDDKRAWETGVHAINEVLPDDCTFDSVSADAGILFTIQGRKVPTTALSDGYRSVLAFVGDLTWRLLTAFPESENPLAEHGVVLIDELDIHLHPKWQRDLPGKLRELFPQIQFIVATHSPLVAAGAGEDALTLRLSLGDGLSEIDAIRNVAFLSVDSILQSDAFQLVSTYSPQTQLKLDMFDRLTTRGDDRTDAEEEEYQMLLGFMEEARPYGGPPDPGSLDARVESLLDRLTR